MWARTQYGDSKKERKKERKKMAEFSNQCVCAPRHSRDYAPPPAFILLIFQSRSSCRMRVSVPVSPSGADLTFERRMKESGMNVNTYEE